MLSDAHPPRMIPYTPMLLAASTSKIPAFGSATTSGTSRPKSRTGGPIGITAYTNSAATTEMMGATRNTNRSARAGMKLSLKISLMPSARGCRSPSGPTRFGPTRSWNRARSRRSSSVT